MEVQTQDDPKAKRRYRRFHFDLPVHVVVRRNSREISIPGRGTSMNEGGLAVNVDAELKVGHLVLIQFTPPYSALPIRVRGAVRNADGQRYGLEFVVSDAGEAQEVALFRQMLRNAAGQLGD